MLKFKLDENLPNEAVAIFAAAGFNAMNVLDQQMGGEEDSAIAATCRAERRTIVTLDLDFADIRNYPPADYHGLIVLRLKTLDKRHVVNTLYQLLPMLEAEQLIGRLWIVDESSIRIRE